MPTVASSSLSVVGYEEEHTPGTSNASPALATFRHSNFGLKLEKDSVESEEKRSDRMSSGSRHTIRRANGPVSCDLSHKGHDPAWQGLMGGTWTAGVALAAPGDFSDLSVVAATKTWTLGSGNPITLGLRVGDRVTIANMTETGNNGTFTISGLTATTFTTLEAPGADESTDADATITVDGVKLGIGRSYRAFTFERALTDVGEFLVFNGAYFNKLDMSASPGEIMTLSWEVMAQNAQAMASASIDGTGAVEKDETDFGNITVADNVLTCASSTWAAEGFAVGDSLNISGVTGITDFPTKMLTVVAIATTAMTVAEAVPDGTMTAYAVNKVGLPDYTAAEDATSMTSLEGGLYIGDPLTLIATVTALDISIDNAMGGEGVVGKNYIPNIVWGKKQTVSGNLTALFTDRTMYNRFDLEQAAPLYFIGSDPDGNYYTFRMPRLKFNAGNLGDAVDTGLPVEMEFMAEPSTAAQVTAGWDSSHLTIQRSA